MKVTFVKKEYTLLPDLAGVYLFRDKNLKIIYIGKAKNLKKRVGSYFSGSGISAKTESLVGNIEKIDIIPVSGEFEALLLEADLIRRHHPKYNVIWKDDKHYIYIKITSEDFPRILLSRKEDDGKALFFGPFPSTRVVREMLSLIRNIIPYCNQNPRYKKACFYTHIGLCHPCPGRLKSEPEIFESGRLEYLSHIRQIKSILRGKIAGVRKYLLSEMKKCSGNTEFEKAAIYRDKLRKLEYLIKDYEPTQSYLENPQLLKDRLAEENREFRSVLLKYFPELLKIERIECYDISNISGKFATGSMVTFRDGLPDKNHYRKFRIRSGGEPNDFAMLSEMMQRRLKHPEWPLPDLFIIDGGKPQLLALQKIMAPVGSKVPMIGLAKQMEEFVIPIGGAFLKIALPDRSPALHLIQRIRDEAHRFAHKYHELLRIKSLIPAA